MSKKRIFCIASAIIQKFKLEINEKENILNNSYESLLQQKENADVWDYENKCDPRNFEMGLILEPKPFKLKAIRYTISNSEV